MYIRLYVRLTARENYTVGFSTFRKLYLRIFDFLTFTLQGPQFCKAQHSDPRHFLTTADCSF